MKKSIFLLLAAFIANTAMYAQTCLSNEIAYKVKNEGFANSKLEEIAQFMTDDLGPRLAASQLKLRSEQMVVEKLKELGLTNPRVEFASEFTKGGWDNQMNYVAMTEPYYCNRCDGLSFTPLYSLFALFSQSRTPPHRPSSKNTAASCPCPRLRAFPWQ